MKLILIKKLKIGKSPNGPLLEKKPIKGKRGGCPGPWP
jgi:hypothetical protein